jgi:hypothetical protein
MVRGTIEPSCVIEAVTVELCLPLVDVKPIFVERAPPALALAWKETLYFSVFRLPFQKF